MQTIEFMHNENENTIDENVKAKCIILDPDKIKTFDDFTLYDKQILTNDYGVLREKHFGTTEIQLNHTNYQPSAMIKGKSYLGIRNLVKLYYSANYRSSKL